MRRAPRAIATPPVERDRGCTVILLASYSFQAPAFYQKCGYELAWKLEEFPPGHQNCYLVKRLAEGTRGG